VKGNRESPVSETPTVFVVDDDASFLSALSRLLRAAHLDVKPYSSATDLLANLAPDAQGCLIADLKMPGLGGLDLQDTLIKLDCPMPVIFLTGHGDIPASVRAMRQGAEDFLTKRAPMADLLDAVKRALARDGQVREQRARQRGLRARYDALTPREREVLAHVIGGQLSKQIAYDLGTSERTIKAHRGSIMAKLGLGSVAELVHLANELGIPPARRGS
jgi:FixJ family two-component response regulator